MNRPPEFDAAVLAQRKKLLRYAIAMCHDVAAAEDLVQETVRRAFVFHHRFQDGTNMAAWLFTIQRNLFRSACRTRFREISDSDQTAASAIPVSGRQNEREDLRDAKAIIAQMSAEYRDSLMLIAAGYQYDEAAEIIGVPMGTVKSRVNRARKLLEQRA